MKDIFNRRQRFSLRKYSFGVASVLLGTALFAAHTAQADEVVAPDASSSNPGSSVEGESSSNLVETSTASTAQADPTAAVSSTEATASTFNLTPEASTTDKAAAETTDKQATETAKPTEKATSEAAKPATAASTNAASNNVETTASATTAAATPAATAANRTAATAAPVTEETAAAETAAAATSVKPNVTARAYSVRAAAEDRSATLDRAATDMTNGGALATSRSRRNRRALTDHNVAPIDVVTTLAPNVTADPGMTDPNGASVHSQTIPAGYQAKEGDFYTYGIWNLTEFNKRYNTNYYARAYKNFDTSTDTTVELIDKNTGNVVETHTVTATSGVQKFTTTGQKSNKELTLQVDYQAGAGQGPGKTDQPFIQMGFEVGSEIQSLVAAGHNLTPAEQARFDAVYAARNSNDIMNVVEPAYNGRRVTDTNFKIPINVEKTTYYKVVDQKNSTYKATGKSVISRVFLINNFIVSS